MDYPGIETDTQYIFKAPPDIYCYWDMCGEFMDVDDRNEVRWNGPCVLSDDDCGSSFRTHYVLASRVEKFKDE